MALTKFTTALNSITSLPVRPNASLGLTYQQLQQKFEDDVEATQDFINDTLTTEIDSTFATKAELNAAVIGAVPTLGDVADLNTVDKSTAVAAINEVNSSKVNVADKASQSDAQTGTDNTKYMTALRTLESIQQNGLKMLVGSYTGNGNASQFINLGVTPKAVLSIKFGSRFNDNFDNFGALAVTGHPAINEATSTSCLEITTNGFNAINVGSGGVDSYLNETSDSYNYIALY